MPIKLCVNSQEHIPQMNTSHHTGGKTRAHHHYHRSIFYSPIFQKRLTHCHVGGHWSSDLVHSCLSPKVGDQCSKIQISVLISKAFQRNPGHKAQPRAAAAAASRQKHSVLDFPGCLSSEGPLPCVKSSLFQSKDEFYITSHLEFFA